MIFNLYGKILLSGLFSLPKCVKHQVLPSIWNGHPYLLHTLDQCYAFCRWKRLAFTMKTSVLLVSLFVLPLISAQVPHWGPCPEPDVQPGFSLKQVQGLCRRIGCHSRITLPSSVGSKWKAKTCFSPLKIEYTEIVRVYSGLKRNSIHSK